VFDLEMSAVIHPRPEIGYQST